MICFQQWTKLCVEESRIAAWKLHKHFYTIRGTYKENKDAFFKTKTVTGAISGTGISHEEVEVKED